MGKRVQSVKEWEIELYPGWYAIRNSRRLHYFNLQENSLCGAHTWHEPIEAGKDYPKCSYCEKKSKDG